MKEGSLEKYMSLENFLPVRRDVFLFMTQMAENLAQN